MLLHTGAHPKSSLQFLLNSQRSPAFAQNNFCSLKFSRNLSMEVETILLSSGESDQEEAGTSRRKLEEQDPLEPKRKLRSNKKQKVNKSKLRNVIEP